MTSVPASSSAAGVGSSPGPGRCSDVPGTCGSGWPGSGQR